MIRFRNPISDMNVLIQNFRKMYIDFSNMESFNLDNIAEFFARERLASSSGYIGNEALLRSYQIKDDSRKSMKMQAKSYAELFRLLGWITSGKKALNFNFTYLGIHIALTGSGAKSLFEQCLLGVSYPNHILDVKFSDINKPFVSMLLFADSLDGKICRDELLLSAMNMRNGYNTIEFTEKVKYIQSLRKTKKIQSIDNEINKLAEENEMQPNSVRNLTRFVISSLEFTGWFTKQHLRIYSTSRPFLVLTQKGRDTINTIKNSLNINGNELDSDDIMTKKISKIALLNMFKRAGFEVQEEIKVHSSYVKDIEIKYGNKEILFSPYQFFNKEELDRILHDYIIDIGREQRFLKIEPSISLYTHNKEFFVEAKSSELSKNQKITKELKKRLKEANFNLNIAKSKYVSDIRTMKQADFYPLVADLLGYIFNRDAFPPPAGNNNMRYDVIIPDENFSIPVEVKSPAEEEMLSVKAIRQATENKILLLARKPFPTDFEISSFACGFNIPNERSDVYKLIDEIYNIYKINIAILDIHILINAAFFCALSQKFYDVSDFKNKRGVIKFEN